jgi:hypothetical protein
VRCTGRTIGVSRGIEAPRTRTAHPSGACPTSRTASRTRLPGVTRSDRRSERPARATSTVISIGEGGALRGRVSGIPGFPRTPFELPRCIRTTRSRIWRLGRARLPQHPTRRGAVRFRGLGSSVTTARRRTRTARPLPATLGRGSVDRTPAPSGSGDAVSRKTEAGSSPGVAAWADDPHGGDRSGSRAPS